MTGHTDIRKSHWIYDLMPASLHPYLLMMRIDRPTGVWLLCLPCFWGLALAKPSSFPWRESLLFLTGAFLMRSAGCIYNDIADRKIDQKIERTALRPLASGTLNLLQVSFMLLLLLGLSFLVLLQFNSVTIMTGILSVILITLYPWMKRITYWPQLFLGLAFNWGVLLGWVALQGELTLAPLILYGAGIFWTLGYDTFYAFQDREDDLRIGVKSTALRFQNAPRLFLTCMYAGLHGCLFLLGFLQDSSFPYFGAVALLSGPLYGQVILFDSNNKQQALKLFRFNGWIGVLVLGCLLLV